MGEKWFIVTKLSSFLDGCVERCVYQLTPSILQMIMRIVKRCCFQWPNIALPLVARINLTAKRLSFSPSDLEKAEWVGLSERVAVVLFVCLFDSYLCDAKRSFL